MNNNQLNNAAQNQFYQTLLSLPLPQFRNALSHFEAKMPKVCSSYGTLLHYVLLYIQFNPHTKENIWPLLMRFANHKIITATSENEKNQYVLEANVFYNNWIKDIVNNEHKSVLDDSLWDDEKSQVNAVLELLSAQRKVLDNNQVIELLLKVVQLYSNDTSYNEVLGLISAHNNIFNAGYVIELQFKVAKLFCDDTNYYAADKVVNSIIDSDLLAIDKNLYCCLLFTRANIYYKSNKINEAIAICLNAFDYIRKNNLLLSYNAFQEYQYLYIKILITSRDEGNYEIALAALQNLMRANVGDELFLQYVKAMGDFYLVKNDFNMAELVYREAFRLVSEDDTIITVNLAYSLLKQNKLSEAGKYLKAYHQKHPDSFRCNITSNLLIIMNDLADIPKDGLDKLLMQCHLLTNFCKRDWLLVDQLLNYYVDVERLSLSLSKQSLTGCLNGLNCLARSLKDKELKSLDLCYFSDINLSKKDSLPLAELSEFQWLLLCNVVKETKVLYLHGVNYSGLNDNKKAYLSSLLINHQQQHLENYRFPIVSHLFNNKKVLPKQSNSNELIPLNNRLQQG